MMFEVKKLSKGEALYPYWGKNFNKITGLDPLGQQNASERIYSHLLPGITNLTNRIRYYGFYCWILWQYEKLNENNLNQSEHRRFIRRSEFTVALFMNKMEPGVSQIPGSNKANEVLNESNEVSKIDISKFADDNKEGAYWKYSTGALGQYYVASLRQIGLVKEMITDGKLFYMVTDNDRNISGKVLALAFEENLKPSSIEKFLRTLENGTFNLRETEELYSSFNLAKVPTKTNEWQIYWSLLNGPNDPISEQDNEFYRRETINVIKDKANTLPNGVNSSMFLDSLFEWGLSVKQVEFNTKFGWFQYRLNEYWQLSCGANFWAILNFLSGEKNGIYLKKNLIQEFADQIFNEMQIDPHKPIKELFKKFDMDALRYNYQAIYDAVKANDSVIVGKSAFDILMMLFSQDIDSISKYLEMIEEKGLNKRGSFLNVMHRYIKNESFEKTALQFITEYISSDILFRHRIVAFNKLGSGSRSTLKFEIEDDRILYDGNFEPSFTNPRIDTLLKILDDLDVLRLEEDYYYPGPAFNTEA